ncbi:MAG: hypothetical protein IH861_06845 [Chloroflexi bacterium]|nr:hypothetical protein [Chloroflexota bacterium]
MRSYKTPDNVVELLGRVVDAAKKTTFYSSIVPEGIDIASPADLSRIPVTSLTEYRNQRLADVLAEPDRVQWIVGAYRGQLADAVAIAEGPDEAAIRFDIFMDALKDCLSGEKQRTCAIVSSAERMFFAAETATILIHSGMPAHVFLDGDRGRTYELLHITRPDVVVILLDDLDEAELPAGVEVCVTFRQSQTLRSVPQLDMYLVDELGFLGQSRDCEKYLLNSDEFFFQTSEDGRLVVTALRNQVRPLVRIETLDRVESMVCNTVEFAEMSKLP